MVSTFKIAVVPTVCNNSTHDSLSHYVSEDKSCRLISSDASNIPELLSTWKDYHYTALTVSDTVRVISLRGHDLSALFTTISEKTSPDDGEYVQMHKTQNIGIICVKYSKTNAEDIEMCIENFSMIGNGVYEMVEHLNHAVDEEVASISNAGNDSYTAEIPGVSDEFTGLAVAVSSIGQILFECLAKVFGKEIRYMTAHLAYDVSSYKQALVLLERDLKICCISEIFV